MTDAACAGKLSSKVLKHLAALIRPPRRAIPFHRQALRLGALASRWLEPGAVA